MCGQLGFSGKTNYDINKLRTLIYINAIERGMDATGIYSPVNGLKKTLDSGRRLSGMTKPEHLIKPDNFFMAHCRAATVGAKEDVNNTHPFKNGNYILQHNGTLTNHWDLRSKYGLEAGKHKVDSDIICACINKCDSISTILKEINGPAAIIINDIRKPDILYVFRNKERPLYKGIIDGNMYISSVPESLRLVDCINIKEFKENTLYTIEYGSIKSTLSIKNNPYIIPIVVSNSSSTPYTYLNRKSILKSVNCWIRGNGNWTIINGKGSFKLERDKYYLAERAIDTETLRIVDIDTDLRYDCLIRHLMVDEDSIYQDDLIRAEIDIESRYTKGLIVCKKGEIFKVRESFNDGELTLNSPGTKSYLTTAKKIFFKKLKPDEILEYNTLNEEFNSSLPSIINRASESAKAFIEAGKIAFPDEDPLHEEVEDIIINNSCNDDEEESEEDDVILSNGDLVEHFTEMDDKLEKLLDDSNIMDCPVKILNQICSIRDVNFAAFEIFTLQEESNEK